MNNVRIVQWRKPNTGLLNFYKVSYNEQYFTCSRGLQKRGIIWKYGVTKEDLISWDVAKRGKYTKSSGSYHTKNKVVRGYRAENTQRIAKMSNNISCWTTHG